MHLQNGCCLLNLALQGYSRSHLRSGRKKPICARASPGTNLSAKGHATHGYCLLTAQRCSTQSRRPQHCTFSLPVLGSKQRLINIVNQGCCMLVESRRRRCKTYLTLLRYNLNHILRSRVTGDAPHIILIPVRYWLPVTCHGQVVA